jgi:hypothetical protein
MCAHLLGDVDEELELEELAGKTQLLGGNLVASRNTSSAPSP